VEWRKILTCKIKMESTRKNKGRMVSPRKITGRFTKRSRKMNVLK
jgi:hypothetical protein